MKQIKFSLSVMIILSICLFSCNNNKQSDETPVQIFHKINKASKEEDFKTIHHYLTASDQKCYGYQPDDKSDDKSPKKFVEEDEIQNLTLKNETNDITHIIEEPNRVIIYYDKTSYNSTAIRERQKSISEEEIIKEMIDKKIPFEAKKFRMVFLKENKQWKVFYKIKYRIVLLQATFNVIQARENLLCDKVTREDVKEVVNRSAKIFKAITELNPIFDVESGPCDEPLSKQKAIKELESAEKFLSESK